MKLKNILLAAVLLAAPILVASAQNTDIEKVEQHLYFLADDALLGRGFAGYDYQ